MNYFDFEEIRPYNQEEFADAWERIKINPVFHSALSFLFSPAELQHLLSSFTNFKSTKDFQLSIMHPAIRNIIKKSSGGLSSSGFDAIQSNTSYTFISNHRDIFLDSGILQILLVEHGHDTSEITFGNNLMVNPFIVDIGKVNKMFTVHRTGNRRALYDSSIRLSNYMRYAIKEKKQSTWIAQRNGRTKNGHDETQIGLLKMLFASNSENFESSFSDLNVVPVSISYEFEPCDLFKVNEIYASLNSSYVKAPDEDLKSIIAGVVEPKGRIHLALGTPINAKLNEISKMADPFKALNQHLDMEIHSKYQLYPTHYIAFDLLYHSNQMEKFYSQSEKEFFIEYMQRKLALLNGNQEVLKQLFLELYSNPVRNFIQLQKK